ncbi:MAG: protein CapI, partial [Myxococcales bacterium]|nr:protein CapI [Myxococcales bacterium]
DGIVAALGNLGGYRIYNLGDSSPVTLAELVEAIEAEVGRPAIRQILPMQPGDVERTYADISKAGEELHYRPRVPLRQGIARFVEWLRQ